MDRHLEPAPELPPEDESARLDDGEAPPPRPIWWRWVAMVLVISLVVATPFAYALYRVLH